MKNLILFISIVSSFIISCNNNSTDPSGSKPLTSNVPSDNKYKKEGTSLSDYYGTSTGSPIPLESRASSQTYNLLDRLYSTVWYQSESDYDDGRLEVEEEFIFFNSSSSICKREYENGKLDGEMNILNWKFLRLLKLHLMMKQKLQTLLL